MDRMGKALAKNADTGGITYMLTHGLRVLLFPLYPIDFLTLLYSLAPLALLTPYLFHLPFIYYPIFILFPHNMRPVWLLYTPQP